MKRIGIMAVVGLVCAIALVACAPKTATPSPAANKGPIRQDFDNALPPPSQVTVGLFKLEGTDKAVTAAQAAKLLPVFKAYRTMSAGASVSPLEVEALVRQIQDNLTAEQLESIAAMRLTSGDMASLMQTQGLGAGPGPQAVGTESPQQQATRQALRQAARGSSGGAPGVPGGGPGGGQGGRQAVIVGGPMPGGGVPIEGGGAGMPGGQSSQSQQNAAAQARGGFGGATTPTLLLEAVIKLLQSKVS